MRQWYKTVIIFFIISLAAAISYGYKNRSYELVGISDAAYFDDNIYMMDNDGSIFNFFRVDSSGMITGEIDTPKLLNGWWSNYSHLAVDVDGSSYVYGYQRSMDKKEERSVVFYCDYKNRKLVPVWELPDSKIIQIHVQDGVLYTVLPHGDKGEQAAFYAIEKGGNSRMLFLADTPYLNMVNAFYRADNEVYWSDYHGIIYRNGEVLLPQMQKSNRQYHVSFHNYGVVYTDSSDRTVKKILFEDGTAENLYPTAALKTFHERLDDSDIMPLQYGEDGSVLASMDLDDTHRILAAFYPDGVQAKEWTELLYSPKWMATQVLNVFIAVFLTLLLIWIFVMLGLKLTKGMVPLMFKLAMGMIPVIVIFGYILEVQIGLSMQNKMIEMEYNLLYALADEKLSRMNPQYFKQMDITAIPEDPYYKRLIPEADFSVLNEVLHNEMEGEDKDIVVRTYQWIYILDQGFLKYMEMDDSYYGARIDDFRNRALVSLMEESMEEQSIIKTQYNDSEGNWISVFVPIVDETGVSIGVMESGMTVGTILHQSETLMKEIELRIIFVMLLLSIILIAILSFALGRIQKLQSAVGRMAAGHLGETVAVRGRDEIAGITGAFNMMSGKMKDHVDFIRQCSDAYARFVPEKIYDILKREDVTCIQLGDYQEINAGMLLVHDNNFRERTRTMDGERLFSMINGMMEKMVPLVTEQDGIVEKMRESGLTGFFVEDSKHALESALSIFESLEGMRKKEDSIPDFRAAVTYGRIRFGVVGHAKRVEASTVTELSALSSFLVEVAEKYGTYILVTAAAANQIPDFKDHYKSRLLGYIYMETLEVLEGVYDVFDGDNREQRKLKLETRDLFQAALSDYLAGEYYEARQKFASILRINTGDKAAKEYIYRCDLYYQTKERNGKETYMEIY